MRVTVCYYPHDAPGEALAVAQLVDELGFHGFYLTDSPLRHDPWPLMGATALGTSRVRIGPSAIRMAATDPLTVARGLATLDTMSDGRVDAVLGVGSFFRHGAAGRVRPTAFMRECFEAVRNALEHDRPQHAGEYHQYSVDGISMRARPVQERIPLIFGSSGGPKLIELAGEIADGVYLAPAATRSAFDHLVRHARVGAERVGRDWRSLDIALSPIVVCASDGQLAREVARVHSGFYIPMVSPALFDALSPRDRSFDDFRAIASTWGQDVKEAVSLVKATDAELFAVAGTPTECREQLSALVGGTDIAHLSVMFADASHVEMLTGEAPRGIPPVREQVGLFHREVVTPLGWA